MIAVLSTSCARNQRHSVPNTRGPIRIVFNCAGATGQLGLVGDNNQPAWKIERDQGVEVRWEVPRHVTINSIRLKTGGAIPVNVTQNPDGPGTPLVGIVNGIKDRSYPYNIDATCQQGGNTVRLVIDPEMIVR
jgi:hypothetical protein